MGRFWSALGIVYLTLAILPGQRARASNIEQSDSFVPIKFVKIPAGTFLMGSPESDKNRGADETQHQVTLTHAFEMQVTEVTQHQWSLIAPDIAKYPSGFSKKAYCPEEANREENGRLTCPNHPEELVNWEAAADFADAFSLKKGLKPCYGPESVRSHHYGREIYQCKGYRLPTEAEWEYVARDGKTANSYSGNYMLAELSRFVIFAYNNPGSWGTPQTADVGSLEANSWGIYDIFGNVFQWVTDTYGPFSTDPVTDPVGDFGTADRVFRGTSFENSEIRIARRAKAHLDQAFPDVGFRLVRTVKD